MLEFFFFRKIVFEDRRSLFVGKLNERAPEIGQKHGLKIRRARSLRRIPSRLIRRRETCSRCGP
jgi:hypothetical protein